jgi:poly-gamma-glutamate capsule biosynthesis protein CapA/YwtB (metallophosphatase superfamily)
VTSIPFHFVARLLAKTFLCLVALINSNVWAETVGPSVSIVFVGDIMLDQLPGKLIEEGIDPFAAFADILRAADLRIGNLECVVGTTGSAWDKFYTFRANPRVLPILKRHFTALSLANNHSGDFGPMAFAEMLDLLDRERILYFGGGRTLSEAHAPLLFEHKGLRIALLGFNEVLPRSFEADFDKPGIAWSDDEQVQADIKNARTRYKADIVITFMHWGWEHEPFASKRQRQLAHLMIESGADAVIGGHPHVTQDIEHHNGKPIFYSLGHFVFDGFSDQDNNTGWLLRLELDKKGVRQWKTYTAEIDHNGIPHPAPHRKGYCYQRDNGKEISCDARP